MNLIPHGQEKGSEKKYRTQEIRKILRSHERISRKSDQSDAERPDTAEDGIEICIVTKPRIRIRNQDD